MSSTPLSDLPAEFTAGDRLHIRRSVTGYPASDGWLMLYALAMEGQQILLSSTPDGDAHVIDKSPADTASYPPGRYSFYCLMKKDTTDRATIGEGFVEIRPDLEAATEGYDARPSCYIVRDALKAAIEKRATETQSAISVRDRTISEMSHSELIDALQWAERRCANYERALRKRQGKPTGSQIKVSFR